MWLQIYEVEYSFFIASEKPVIHEAYFTNQSSATVRQITSESPLHPGKSSSSTGYIEIYKLYAGYVGYTRGHLHERVDGHKQKSSSICKHYFGDHNSNVPPCLSEQIHVLTKCTNKFDCLIKEMLFIRKLKPSLNVQTDSIRAKVFTWRTCDPLLLC